MQIVVFMYLSSFVYNYCKYSFSLISEQYLFPYTIWDSTREGKPCKNCIEQTAKLIQHYNYFLDFIRARILSPQVNAAFERISNNFLKLKAY